MVEFAIRMSRDGARRLTGTIGKRRAELAAILSKSIEDDKDCPAQERSMLDELTQVQEAIVKAMERENQPCCKTSDKQPPVDRGKLLIGLECCRDAECGHCPYDSETFENCNQVAFDALAYICWLEEQLEEAGKT